MIVYVLWHNDRLKGDLLRADLINIREGYWNVSDWQVGDHVAVRLSSFFQMVVKCIMLMPLVNRCTAMMVNQCLRASGIVRVISIFLDPVK